MKLALGLDVQTNAKGGKFMSIEDSRQGALVCKADVEVLWEPGNFQDDGAKRVGVCFASNTDLELWTEEVEQGVIDNMIVFQKPFPGAAHAVVQPHSVQLHFRHSHKDALGYLSAGPDEAQPRPHPHALRAVLGCLATPIGWYRFVATHDFTTLGALRPPAPGRGSPLRSRPCACCG